MPNRIYLSDLLLSEVIKINNAFQGLGIPSTNPADKSPIDSVLADIGMFKEQFLAPVTIFHNEVSEYDNEPLGGAVKCKQFYVSLGIFDLDKTSAVAEVTKDNKLQITWSERAGKGKFTSTIPSYLVATSAPVLSYEGGVLDIRVNVKSKNENELLFVGRLVEEKQTNEGKGASYTYQKPERVCGRRID
jgi:hypothetical protein